MDEEFKGKIRYEDLRQFIFNYFKKNQGLDLMSTSIDYLKGKLIGTYDLGGPFFIVKGEFGEARFDISKEDIEKILKSTLASKNIELTGVEYDYDVVMSYKKNSKVNQNNDGEIVKLELTYDGKISYENLRQIIFDYYKENQGIVLSSTSIDYLKGKLMGTFDYGGPFFIEKDEFGERRFDIPKEQIQEIFKSYLSSKNYELQELSFSTDVKFKYKPVSKQKEEMQQKSEMVDGMILQMAQGVDVLGTAPEKQEVTSVAL